MANEAKFEYDLLNLWESVFNQNFPESNNLFGLIYRWKSLIDFFQRNTNLWNTGGASKLIELKRMNHRRLPRLVLVHFEFNFFAHSPLNLVTSRTSKFADK